VESPFRGGARVPLLRLVRKPIDRAPLWLLCPGCSSWPELGLRRGCASVRRANPGSAIATPNSPPDDRLVFQPRQGAGGGGPQLAGRHPPRPRRPEMSVPSMPPTYTAYQDCNSGKTASDFVAAGGRSFKAGAWRRRPAFLADCWPAAVEALRLPSSILMPTSDAFPTTRRPGPDLRRTGHCRGAVWRWRRPWAMGAQRLAAGAVASTPETCNGFGGC